MVTCRPCSVKRRLSSVLCGRCLPLQQQGAHSVGLTWRVLALEVRCIHGTVSCEHPWEIVPDLCVNRDPEGIEKRLIIALLMKRPWPGRNCSISGLLQVPSLPALHLRSETGLEVSQRPLPMRQVPTGAWRAQPAMACGSHCLGP